MADDVVVVEAPVVDVQRGVHELRATRTCRELGPQLAKRPPAHKMQVLTRMHGDRHAILAGRNGRWTDR